MISFSSSRKKMQFICTNPNHLIHLLLNYCRLNIHVRFLNPFFIHVLYFVSVSFIGFGILKTLKPRTDFRPRNIDLFFTSVSSVTVSSMSTIEMEVLSNSQLILMTVLMFIGGEVFTSLLQLHLKTRGKTNRQIDSVDPHDGSSLPDSNSLNEIIKLRIVTIPDSTPRPYSDYSYPFLRNDSTKFLGFVVLGYLLGVQTFGVVSVLLYLSLVPTANNVLKNKALKPFTFAAFLVVSSFANCGYVPTNENMIVFRENSGLLWILIPQILLGNTLFPSSLRFLIWVLGKKFKKQETKYLLENPSESGYNHLLPRMHSLFLVLTVLGFISASFLVFCLLEWDSDSLSGLNPYQKVVGVLFECVNVRHSGETIVDLSSVAPAVLLIFVVMMYLPPDTTFMPLKKCEEIEREGKEMQEKKKRIAESFIFSPLSCLVIFIILICIIERKNLKDDPLNFSVLNIVVEVISAYGNVGFTTGYSCSRQIRQDPTCVNKWYGFSGKWSDQSKIVLVVVMLFGRLKKFNMDGGQRLKAWELLRLSVKQILIGIRPIFDLIISIRIR